MFLGGYAMYKSSEDMPPQCPPVDVIAGDKEPVFRFITGDSLNEIDFLNHAERNISYPPSKKCEALALSFMTEESAVKLMQQKFNKFRKMNVAKGRITKECGVHKIQRHHLNLWLFKGVEMMNIFIEGEEA